MPRPGTDPEVRSPRRPPRALLLRGALLLAILAAGVVVARTTPLGELLDRERLSGLLDTFRAAAWAPWALIGLYAVLSPLGLPVSTLVFAGGAVFGTLWGWVFNLVGCIVGASLSYLVGRALGHDLVAHWIGESRAAGMERLLERHAFWTLLRVRLFPIPFALVNYGAALAGVPFTVFLVASSLGMAPSVLAYSYFFDTLVSAAAEERSGMALRLGAALVAVLLVTFLPAMVRWWRARGD